MNNKQYKSIEFFIGQEELDICKGPQDFYIHFTYDDLKAFQHPRFFIRKSDNKGIFRLDFCTYFPVAIPDKFKTELNSCKQIEVILSANDNSEHISRYVPVAHVLKFPEFYDLNLQDSESDTTDLVKIPDFLENSPLNQMGTLETELDDQDDSVDSLTECDEIMNENFEHFSCQYVLDQWLEAHKDFSMHIQQYNDYRFWIMTDLRSSA